MFFPVPQTLFLLTAFISLTPKVSIPLSKDKTEAFANHFQLPRSLLPQWLETHFTKNPEFVECS